MPPHNRIPLHQAAAELATAQDFSLLHDSANRNLIVARSEHFHGIVAEAVDYDTGVWMVACLRHGAQAAAEELAEAQENADGTTEIGRPHTP